MAHRRSSLMLLLLALLGLAMLAAPALAAGRELKQNIIGERNKDNALMQAFVRLGCNFQGDFDAQLCSVCSTLLAEFCPQCPPIGCSTP